MEITRGSMEAALQYLAETDEEMARLRALHNGLTNQKATIRAMAFMGAKEGPVAQKEHAACLSFQYQQHLEKIELAEIEMLTMQNRRQTQELIIDCWRSLNAARNRQQIV
jgi:hypothetical protein